MIKKCVDIGELSGAQILRYAGCGPVVDDNISRIVTKAKEDVLRESRAVYVYEYFKISQTDEGVAVENTELILRGNDIKKHLKGCERIALLCATLSLNVDRLIHRTSVRDMAEAVILNGAAAAAVEYVCDMAQEEIKKDNEGFYLTFRYGTGYGDLPVTHQSQIVNILDATRLAGISVNDACMMTPSKSVVSVIGICSRPVDKGARGCITCNLRETCGFRKKGLTCNM